MNEELIKRALDLYERYIVILEARERRAYLRDNMDIRGTLEDRFENRQNSLKKENREFENR